MMQSFTVIWEFESRTSFVSFNYNNAFLLPLEDNTIKIFSDRKMFLPYVFCLHEGIGGRDEGKYKS